MSDKILLVDSHVPDYVLEALKKQNLSVRIVSLDCLPELNRERLQRLVGQNLLEKHSDITAIKDLATELKAPETDYDNISGLTTKAHLDVREILEKNNSGHYWQDSKKQRYSASHLKNPGKDYSAKGYTGKRR